ncbi:MAG: DUF58 domain-containing protein [Thermoguttaceae bacterium]|jgi:uncharacterized protein (DUF58 family)
MIGELAKGLAERSLYLVFPAFFFLFAIAGAAFKTYPAPRAIAVFAVAVFASALGFIFESDFPQGLVLAVSIAASLTLLVDWLFVLFVGRDVTAVRNTEEVAALGRPHNVEIVLSNRGKRPITCEVVDDSCVFATSMEALATIDALASVDTDEVDLASGKNFAYFARRSIPGESRELLNYRLLWSRRGVFQFKFVALRFSGPLRLWRRYKKVSCESTFRVYPNLCQLSRQELFARKNQFLMQGVRRTRRVGQDSDFERLREYTPDDQYKFIDWKATARHNKLIVRDFQATRNQRVIIALDAGRMTMNRSGGITLFDCALNSTLALAYIALRQGDEVGCLVFSDEIKVFVPPRGGASHMNSIIRGVFDAFPERVESRYDRAFAYLKTHSTKRALIVLATNVLDERNAEQIQACMTNLCSAHLPLGLFLRERSLFDAVERFDKIEEGVRVGSDSQVNPVAASSSGKLSLWMKQYRDADPVDELERAFKYDGRVESSALEDIYFQAGAAAQILNWRRKTLANLEARGVLALDVFPEDATAPLVNKYLEIKARKLL